MERARRRRHVPAFGEWNYDSSTSSPDEPAQQLPPTFATTPGWPWYAPEPEACSDVWFRYSPPPRRPAPKKVRRPAAVPPAEKAYYGGGGKGAVVVPAARARAPGSGAAVAARTPARSARRVVRPVDEDLYQVPPPDCGRSRRKKSMWMGCLGLNCVA